MTSREARRSIHEEALDRMGNLGMPEMIFILVLALLLFGPKKLPEIGKQVGKALGDFKRASNDLKRTFEEEVEKATALEESKSEVATAVPPEGTVSSPSANRAEPVDPTPLKPA